MVYIKQRESRVLYIYNKRIDICPYCNSGWYYYDVNHWICMDCGYKSFGNCEV